MSLRTAVHPNEGELQDAPTKLPAACTVVYIHVYMYRCMRSYTTITKLVLGVQRGRMDDVLYLDNNYYKVHCTSIGSTDGERERERERERASTLTVSKLLRSCNLTSLSSAPDRTTVSPLKGAN